jgi:hypothetical protein
MLSNGPVPLVMVLVGRGVLLDIPRLRGASWLEPGEHVLREELMARLGALVVGEAHQVHGLFRVVGQECRSATGQPPGTTATAVTSRQPTARSAALSTGNLVSLPAEHERHQRTP